MSAAYRKSTDDSIRYQVHNSFNQLRLHEINEKIGDPVVDFALVKPELTQNNITEYLKKKDNVLVH